jgi:hypothetical protein
VYITDNIMFRNFWENGKLMLCNAIFFWSINKQSVKPWKALFQGFLLQ